MRKLFARRYMREHVGTTEKVVGAVVLLLLGGIIAAFVIQSATNTDYLFDVDQSAVSDREGVREMAVARQMLPPLGDPGWADAAGVEVVPAEDVPVLLSEEAADLAAFDVQRAYRGRYETKREPFRELEVVISDAQSPAQAFGLWCARRPADAGPLNVGRGGWTESVGSAGARAGFWNGRYYTELRSADLSGTGMTIAAAAAAIASVQLSYGGPFDAETLLPSEGRLPGTFRYVHHRALGDELLNKVFLVDLAGGVTAWVMDAGSAGEAGALVERIEQQSVSSAGADYGGYGGTEGGGGAVRHEGPVIIVPHGAGQLAVFAVGKYVHGAYGEDAERVLAAAMSAYDAAAPAGMPLPRVAAAASPSEAANPFPDPGVPGWSRPREASRYTPDNLYVKIDGRVGLYIQFHVVGLTFGTYFHEREGERTIDVYWYDMGDPVNAFGMYRAEVPPDVTTLDIGRAGYQVGGAVFFWKGTDYVQVLPAKEDEADARVAAEIAGRIAERIEDNGEPLWAARVLPETGRVPDSLDFVAENAFNLEFLNDVFSADYDIDGSRVKLFVHRAEDPAAAGGLFDAYVAFLQEYGKVVWRDPDAARRIVAGDVDGMIDVVFVKGRYLGGVTGADRLEAARDAAVAFYDGLGEPEQPGNISEHE